MMRNTRSKTVNLYRDRIYSYYNSARNKDLAPTSIEGLKKQAPYLKKLIYQHFPKKKDSHILDLGCGYGALVHFAQQAGYFNIAGVDTSPEQIETAHRLGINNIEQADLLEKLASQSNASMDAILAFDILEHFFKDEIIILLDEIYRVLKPGGRLILHTPNGESPFSSRIHFGDFTHEFIFTRTSIAQVVLSSTFSSIQCYEDAPFPYSVSSFVRSILWQFIRQFLRFYIAIETGETSKNQIFSQNFLSIAIK